MKINATQFFERMKNLTEVPLDVMKQAHPYLRNKTPIASGNARNKTKRQQLKIKSNYAYAGRLDEGWSKQAPNGFTDPTINELDKFVKNKIKRI